MARAVPPCGSRTHNALKGFADFEEDGIVDVVAAELTLIEKGKKDPVADLIKDFESGHNKVLNFIQSRNGKRAALADKIGGDRSGIEESLVHVRDFFPEKQGAAWRDYAYLYGSNAQFATEH